MSAAIYFPYILQGSGKFVIVALAPRLSQKGERLWMSALAALKAGRHYVGYETNEEYLELLSFD
jgi:hypothetical protein